MVGLAGLTPRARGLQLAPPTTGEALRGSAVELRSHPSFKWGTFPRHGRLIHMTIQQMVRLAGFEPAASSTRTNHRVHFAWLTAVRRIVGRKTAGGSTQSAFAGISVLQTNESRNHFARSRECSFATEKRGLFALSEILPCRLMTDVPANWAERIVAGRKSNGKYQLGSILAHALAVIVGCAAVAVPQNAQARGDFLIDPVPVGQTPQFFGIVVEILTDSDRSNIWDWMLDSGMSMGRAPHPDVDLRRAGRDFAPYEKIKTKADFESFRERLKRDPAGQIPWQDYRFDEEVPWFGTPFRVAAKYQACKIPLVLSIPYRTGRDPLPLLKDSGLAIDTPATDDEVIWATAASAYEDYLAHMFAFASRFGVTHFMMVNEPKEHDEDAPLVRSTGVVAHLARMALEDTRANLADQKLASELSLSGPANYLGREIYWKHVSPYVDFMDYHYYDPDGRMHQWNYSRAEAFLAPFGKRIAMTEFGRIGGPMQMDEILFGMRPSLQVADIAMAVLSAARPNTPGFEMALFYEFAFPAVSRNRKSLVYGDLNLADFTGDDSPLRGNKAGLVPTFEEMQLRAPTPAYYAFKMIARCAPGLRADGLKTYPVLAMRPSDDAFTHRSDPSSGANVYRKLNPELYAALGGAALEIRSFAVKTPERLYALILNQSPTEVKSVRLDVSRLDAGYRSAVVRELSQRRRDEPIAEIQLSRKPVTVDFPPYSLTQIIFVKDDLSLVEELKVEEAGATPGRLAHLGKLETTRLRTLGRIGQDWIDLTELNILWSSSLADSVRVYHGGLTQRIVPSEKPITLTAKTINGRKKVDVLVSPDIAKKE
jgi:hypothetical protein